MSNLHRLPAGDKEPVKAVAAVKEKSPATMTKEQLAQRNRERKAEINAPARAPTLDEINSYTLAAAQAFVEAPKLRDRVRTLENQLAAAQNTIRILQEQRAERNGQALELQRILDSKS